MSGKSQTRTAAADSLVAIRAQVAKLVQQAAVARRAKDLERVRPLVAERMAAERRGGELLLAQNDVAHAIGEKLSARWRRLGKLSEAQFRAEVAAVSDGHPRPNCPRLHMIYTAFVRGPDGTLSREIYSVDPDAK